MYIKRSSTKKSIMEPGNLNYAVEDISCIQNKSKIYIDTLVEKQYSLCKEGRLFIVLFKYGGNRLYPYVLIK